jgi:glycosyltransferase involved in cell wall biosynthesis
MSTAIETKTTRTRRRQSTYQGIAFVGNYLPRPCGIATFTSDLAEAVAKITDKGDRVIAVAMNDRAEGYAYPDRVKFEVRQEHQIDYSRAADFLNFSRIDVVSLQHEFGIFGGEWGSSLLTMLRDLRRPLVVTCHTVVGEAEPLQREVFSEIAAKAAKLVVMSDLAVALMEKHYGAPRDKIVHIPHGIHSMPFVDPVFYKDKFGVEGRHVLLTFGLLHRKKGIEYMIEALPAVVERHPKTTYLILGATHPAILREEGESYRLSLQRRVRELRLEDHVLFHPHFVELDELLEYLGAADIFVTPYVNVEHSTSGALAYAMGAGTATVSTPYWYAKELLGDGRGRLVPIADSAALATQINDLLDDEVALSSIRKKAYLYSRRMIWPRVARDYLDLFAEVRTHLPKVVPAAWSLRRPLSAADLPAPRIDHLLRLCDDTGPSHYARYTVPDWSYGYRLEDAALVLVTSAKFHNLFDDADAVRLANTCLALLHVLIGDGRHVAEGLDYNRSRLGPAGETAITKALWALGFTVSQGPAPLSAAANDLFQELLLNTHVSTMRGQSYAVLGAVRYHERFPGASDVRRFLLKHAAALMESCREPGWIDRWEFPDWPVPVHALIMAAGALDNAEMRGEASRLVGVLRRCTEDGTLFLRPGDNPDEEELPVTAATFIRALGAAYYSERTPDLLQPVRAAAEWFLGINSKGVAVYDFATRGCCDALTASGPNRNQGTEATAFCLLSMLTLNQIASVEALSGSPTSD